MNDKLLNGRRLYVPLGRNPLEDLNILADCIAASDADLFNQDECVVWIDAGKRVPVNPDTLRKICLQYVVTKHLQGDCKVEYRPYEPGEMTLRTLLMAKSREEGGLIWRLPKAATEPVRLSPQRQQEALARLAIGERPDAIADAYKVPVDTIRQLVPGR